MAQYCVGFISVVSQRLDLRAGNRDLDRFFDLQDAEGTNVADFLQYCKDNLGYQVSSLWRLSRYFSTKPFVLSTLQGMAAIYAGHFAVFAEAVDHGDVRRTVAGFNPESLAASFFKTRTLREGGDLPGRWYDDEAMFFDGAKRVISVPVSEDVYEVFRRSINDLKEGRSTLFVNNQNVPMVYGWYDLDDSRNKYNCVTAGLFAVRKIISNMPNVVVGNDFDEGIANLDGLNDLENLTTKMIRRVLPLVANRRGTLTPVLDVIQTGDFLIDDDYDPLNMETHARSKSKMIVQK